MGSLKNIAMNMWAVGASVFLAVVLSLPFISSNLKLMSAEPAQIVLAVTVAFIAIFWQEIPGAMGSSGDKVKIS